jgi:SAM-dependent methyltransferase
LVSISVFTPSHRPIFLDDCYAGLCAQTFTDWEWIVVLNGEAPNWEPKEDDPRVRVVRETGSQRVGAVKRVACGLCRGDILVELDHDDVLTPTCLAEVKDAFDRNPGASLVFSDFAQINEDGSPNFVRFNQAMGWEYSHVVLDGVTHLRCHAMEATPHNVGYIWYAPNHVRAFRRDSYEAVGGYNAELGVLDDQELMARLYLAGDFHRIPSCLYLQRMHSNNTQKEAATNAFIQDQTVRYYDQYIESLATAWCRRQGLAVISLRTLNSPPLDDDGGEQQVVDPVGPRLRFDPDTVGLIKGTELLQRLPDRAAFFNECYRVLPHAGLIVLLTPSTDGRGAFQDPTHVAFYNENSFWYLTQRRLREWSLPSMSARLQVSRIHTHFPTSFDEANNISYVQANLLSVKDGPRQGGPLLC